MQRSNLVSTVIQLKALGIDNILVLNGLHLGPMNNDPEHLKYFIHFRSEHDDAKLTSPTGFQVAKLVLFLHVSISSSKMTLASSELGCSDEIIATAAVLSILLKRLSYVCRYIETSEQCYVPGEGIDFT
ncbi:hypothetical protein ARALYDRAFT_892910 [Arabidopsis lyrata subsp. lyrata]|uniref:Uncharacterized protein n=1 Tax=Arabidopsis lyrata subsp. lyrata TaxID=81972 RepID=D7KC85_ARALL|nr:hypothetical protein ARALYDRAFT_892910 [Arabidopsis lyrata subsp. lyrata]